MPTLDWVGKDAVVNHHYDVPYRFLVRKYGDSDDNMVIHGDNLPVLKSLLPQFEGRIKCIYIDPPYNTGNEQWVYNDNVSDPQLQKWLGEVVGREGEDFTRHDKWLCMMYPRLRLMRELLSADGAIFISIDDNEQANLKLMCDEIFGVQNFIATIPWQSRQSNQNDTDISINHEFIVAYAKNRRKKDRRLKPDNANRWHSIEEFAFRPLPIDTGNFDNPDGDPRGPWKADPFDAPNVRPNLTYPIINPNTGVEYLPPKGRHWRMNPERFAAALADGRIIFGKTGRSRPQLKVFLSAQQTLGQVPNSWFAADRYGTATGGTKLLQKIFGVKNVFDTPKPLELLFNFFNIVTDKDSLVLDAFAGSGTTAHAVLNLNKLDGGHRRFILIESQNYAKTITAERVRRVINGYADVEGTGGTFGFYELGEPLFIDDMINPAVTLQQIHKYVYFSETRQPLPAVERQYLLGIHNDVAYYYLHDHPLDVDFLYSTLNDGARERIIYAPNCLLSDKFLAKYRAEFKRIPSDILKL